MPHLSCLAAVLSGPVGVQAATGRVGPILMAVVGFGLLIVIHELGHFAVARLCGMRVERFSVGFGPVLLRARGLGTEWALSAIPLGGYVKIAGMAVEDEVQAGDPASYANQPAWRRFLVILAGPAMNYLLAVVLAAAALLTLGLPQPTVRPEVGRVLPGGAAAAAGLRPGDRLLEVDGRPLASWQALVVEVTSHPGQALTFTVERPGAPSPAPVRVTPSAQGTLGIEQATALVRVDGAGEALARGLRVTHDAASGMVAGLGRLFTPRSGGLKGMEGPVGILGRMVDSAQAGPGAFLGIVWVISVALAVFNLLPIPALDGSRLVFLGYEIVARRRVNQRVENAIHTVGFVALFGLILAVTLFGDLPKLFRR